MLASLPKLKSSISQSVYLIYRQEYIINFKIHITDGYLQATIRYSSCTCSALKQNSSISLSVFQDEWVLIYKYKKQSTIPWWMVDIMLDIMFLCKNRLQVSVYTSRSRSPSCPAPSTLTCWAPVLCCEVNKLLRRCCSVYTRALLLMGTSWEWWRYMHSQTKPHI